MNKPSTCGGFCGISLLKFEHLGLTVGKGCSTFEHDYIYIWQAGLTVKHGTLFRSNETDTVELTLLNKATQSLFNFNPCARQINGNFIANVHRYTSDNGPTTDCARFYTNSGRTSENCRCVPRDTEDVDGSMKTHDSFAEIRRHDHIYQPCRLKCVTVCMCVAYHPCVCASLSLSLSLYIYIYIDMCVCVCVPAHMRALACATVLHQNR